jgi:uncharacterized membrane protein
MAALLLNFRNTIIVSVILALVFLVAYGVTGVGFNEIFFQGVFRWLHVVSGVLWIGLLYYFNFVQIRVMPTIPAELKPAVSKYIAPEALFWFRYAALSTVIMGLGIAGMRHYTLQALSLGLAGGSDPSQGIDVKYTLLGAGMWLGLIMAFNVWVFIWPNQKIALGIVEADADAKAKAGKLATLFSRTNTLLSLPMLVTMTMSQTLFG